MSLKLDAIGWTIAEGQTGEYPLQLRFRQFDEQFTRAAFPVRMNIFWEMTESDNFGYPTSSELVRLHAFENHLVEVQESDNYSVFAMALTGRSEREFVFFTSDSQEFVKRLSCMPQESERYPIKIHRNSDPGWEYFDREVTGVSKA